MGLTFYFFKNNYSEKELTNLCSFINKNGGNVVILENGNGCELENGIIEIINNH